MPLTPEQKTEIEAIRDRLNIKENEYQDLKYTIRAVIDCANGILEDVPQDRDLKTDLSATRLEAFRNHIIAKGNMLAPE